MTIPEKAIICTPTFGDVKKLAEFMREYADREVELKKWETFKEDTCWDMCPDCGGGKGPLFRENRGWYERKVREFDRGQTEYGEYLPTDPSWRFVSVDEFIIRCMEDDLNQMDDVDVEVGDIL